MRVHHVLVALLLASLACSDLTGPVFPTDSVEPFTPPKKYTLWWKQVEACSGRQADFTKMRWYQKKGSGALKLSDGGTYGGYWWEEGNRIALASREDGPIVRHEMLHALLDDGKHPLAMFAGQCAGIVEFDEPEGYGASVADQRSAATVPAETALEVTIHADPVVPSMSQYAGAFTLVVTATNRLPRPVWIDVSGTVLGAAYHADEDFGTGVFTKSKRYLFLPNQSRRAYVDWSEMDGGTIRVQGVFLHVGSPVTVVNVAP